MRACDAAFLKAFHKGGVGGGEQTPTLGLNLTGYLFLYGLNAKNGFYIFKWVKKIKKKNIL